MNNEYFQLTIDNGQWTILVEKTEFIYDIRLFTNVFIYNK